MELHHGGLDSSLESEAATLVFKDREAYDAIMTLEDPTFMTRVVIDKFH